MEIVPPWRHGQDSADRCLLEAAWHGGAARILLRILQQEPRNDGPINTLKMSDDLKTFARSGFRWGAAYLTLTERELA